MKRTNEATKAQKISCSKLVAKTLEDYLRKYENEQLLAALNAAYADFPDEEERKLQEAMAHLQRSQAS